MATEIDIKCNAHNSVLRITFAGPDHLAEAKKLSDLIKSMLRLKGKFTPEVDIRPDAPVFCYSTPGRNEGKSWVQEQFERPPVESDIPGEPIRWHDGDVIYPEEWKQ